MGASDYIFAQAFENHQLPSWLEAHVQAWEFFGGVATITVPDNEKTGVTLACRYEPELNRTYQDLAAHYGTVSFRRGRANRGTRQRSRMRC